MGLLWNSIANEGIRENEQGDYLQSNNLIANNDDYTAYSYALAAQTIAELEGSPPASRLGTEELATTHITHTERNNMANPYELRFRLLEMAQGYLQDRKQEKQEFAYQAWDLAKENGKANMEFWNKLRPDSYSIEDIKKTANELYEFVEKQ